jgi:hypothetical protein
MPHPT